MHVPVVVLKSSSLAQRARRDARSPRPSRRLPCRRVVPGHVEVGVVQPHRALGDVLSVGPDRGQSEPPVGAVSRVADLGPPAGGPASLAAPPAATVASSTDDLTNRRRRPRVLGPRGGHVVAELDGEGVAVRAQWYLPQACDASAARSTSSTSAAQPAWRSERTDTDRRRANRFLLMCEPSCRGLSPAELGAGEHSPSWRLRGSRTLSWARRKRGLDAAATALFVRNALCAAR